MDEIYFFVLTFGLLVAAGCGFPIPEEAPIIGAGIWVGHNAEYGPSRWLLLPVCIFGVVISDGLLYGIGRFWGPRLFETRWVKRFLTLEKRQRIEGNFHKHGIMVLLFARFLPAIRSPIFITAGVMRLSLTRFLLADGIYAIPGVSLLFFLSFWFTDQFLDLFQNKVEKARPILILAGLAVVAVFLIFHFVRRPLSSGDPQELPPIVNQVATTIETITTKANLQIFGTNPEISPKQTEEQATLPKSPKPD